MSWVRYVPALGDAREMGLLRRDGAVARTAIKRRHSRRDEEDAWLRRLENERDESVRQDLRGGHVERVRVVKGLADAGGCWVLAHGSIVRTSYHDH